MKRTFLLFLILLSFLPFSAQTLIDTFPLPYSNTYNSLWGVTSYENNLYLGEDAKGDIHRMSLEGDLIDVIDVHNDIDFNHGLSFDGIYFYVVEDYTSAGANIFKLNGAGNIEESFTLPPVIGGNSSGVGCLSKEDNSLWYTVYYPDFDEYPYSYAYKLDLNSKLITDTIPLIGAQVYGFTIYDEYVVYVTDDLDGDEEKIHIQNRFNNEIILSFPLEDPDGDSSPRGLHWDGAHLWLVAKRPGSAAFAYSMVYKYELPIFSGPEIMINEDTLFYGPLLLGESLSKNICIKNSGTEVLIINDIEFDNAAFQFNGTLPLQIEPNDSIKMEIEFTPDETVVYHACVQLISNAAASEKKVYLEGEGIEPSSILNSLKADQVEIYPNPAQDFIKLKMNLEYSYLEILSIQGQSVLQFIRNKEQQIYPIPLDNGVYLLSVHLESGETISKRFLVYR